MRDEPNDLPNALTPEMIALMERMAQEDGPQPDPTLLPASEGRIAAARGNLRWNIDLPAMAAVRELHVSADPGLHSAECRVRVLVPEGYSAGALLFVHGGGFAFCSPETHERCARVLAIESGMAVVVPDYRLAPEHAYPAGLNDVIACLRALQSHPSTFGLEPGPLLISGDSAGANLALAAMIHEHRLGRRLPVGGILFYGVYSADHTSPSHARFADGPGLTTGKMSRYWDWYVPHPTRRLDPLAAPLQAGDQELQALPPLWLMAAGIDPLLSDTIVLGQRLHALGRQDPVTIVPGVVHGFLQMTVSLHAARKALAEAGAAARRLAQTNSSNGGNDEEAHEEIAGSL
ncbi:alpha/beta hydrolase [Microvirga puerhi]|uniref:Alpha/beta hydrolase n=1 Tax=Microvirga puerhi TaxID=2876078 RepID=A0ABS7VTI2_9HYPH|nr:alpha/beta hydrolase [Microvirga puerhi]MBZ6078400.1 alpha/beta hydrolase [Microvirga puerhi]